MLTLKDLRDPSEQVLASLDVAEADLVCALGLPGSERLDIPACLAWIDRAAAWTKHHTQATLHLFTRNPELYNHSESLYRVLAIDSVLRRGLGVHFNKEVMADLDRPTFDARDDFLHGIIAGRGGTCASLPVLYVAVGRRLGYPLWLARTARHLFARWDDGRGDRFNIEVSNLGGVDTHPDDHYLDWPVPIRGTKWRKLFHFHSLSPREELAGCWTKRAFCLRANGAFRAAAKAFAIAWSLTPGDVLSEGSLEVAMKEWKQTFPEWIEHRRRLDIIWPPRQYPGLPEALEKDIIELDIYDRLLKDSPDTLGATIAVLPASHQETPHVL